MAENKKTKQQKSVFQTHHINYSPEITVVIYKGEHWILTLLGRRKKISCGFIEALERFIETNRSVAVELRK